MAGSAPNYDGVMMPGAGGIRIPIELFGAAGAGKPSGTMDIDWYVVVNGGGVSSITLNAVQVAASAIVVGTMSTTTNNTVNYPAAIPGSILCVKNSTGSSCTFKVTGATGAAVANGSHAILVGTATDLEQWTAAF